MYKRWILNYEQHIGFEEFKNTAFKKQKVEKIAEKIEENKEATIEQIKQDFPFLDQSIFNIQ